MFSVSDLPMNKQMCIVSYTFHKNKVTTVSQNIFKLFLLDLNEF